MKLSPQKQKIFDLHKDGKFHCSTEIEYIRDHRKRISEMNTEYRKEHYADMFESMPCDGRCGIKHATNIFMRKLADPPKKRVVTFIEREGQRVAQVSYQ